MHTTLKCAACGHLHAVDSPQNVCVQCGRPLLAEYRLNELAGTFTPERVRSRHVRSLWRFAEVLPVDRPEDAVSMGEGMTPLVSVRGRGPLADFRRLFVKDESFNPTGSFKARGMSAAITRAKALGTTNGRAALGGKRRRSGRFVCRAGRHGLFRLHARGHADFQHRRSDVAGASVVLVKGLINDCGKIVRQACERFGWFDLSTLKEPFRVEGKKTMGYELAFDFADTGGERPIDASRRDLLSDRRRNRADRHVEGVRRNAAARLDRRTPAPDGGRPGGELRPIVRAFQQGQSHAEVFPNASTVASGLRVPAAIGDFLMLDAIRASQGTAISVSDRDLLAGTTEMSQALGNFVCPEAGAVWSAARRLAEEGWITPGRKNCAL